VEQVENQQGVQGRFKGPATRQSEKSEKVGGGSRPISQICTLTRLGLEDRVSW